MVKKWTFYLHVAVAEIDTSHKKAVFRKSDAEMLEPGTVMTHIKYVGQI